MRYQFEKGNKINAGRVPWNKGKPHMKGENHPLFSKGHKPESILKMSESHKGIYPSDETREKLRARIPWNKGKKCPHDSGENAPNWNGGISFVPYCPKFNRKLKESIRERDGRTCQLCPCTEKENGKKLSVHHVHYDKENCEPDLISLCNKCNSIVNSNRDYYENLFVDKLKKRDLI